MSTDPNSNHSDQQQRATPERVPHLTPVPDGPPATGPDGASAGGVRSSALAAAAAPTPVELSKLQPGDRVDGLLACARKAIVNAASGVTFLVAVLRDVEDKIQARAFERVQELDAQFERGDIVHVRGSVVTYEGERQIKLEQIARHKLTATAAFLPVAYRDLDELEGFLENLAGEVAEPGYARLLESLLADKQLHEAWRTAPCSTSGHHAYLGGVLEHTVAVATIAFELTTVHPRLNTDLLVTAAVVHDVGHTRAFSYSAEILESDAGRLLGHIELGIGILREHARRTRLSQRRWQQLAHCVLTHHGPHGAGVRSLASAEAVALQRIVALDESVKRAFENGVLL